MGGCMLGYRTDIPVLLMLALLAGCASSPSTRFYTLSETAPAGSPPAGAGLVTLTGVTIPGEIDRPQMVRRIGPNQLSISELDRWAAPLDEIIRRVLTEDIARRVASPVPGRQYSVSVDIRELYGDGSCNVTLRAAWRTLKPAEAQAPGATEPVTEDIRVPSAGGACPGTLPATMSIALGELSDRIIAAAAH